MAKKGQVIENKITGEKVTFIETTADSNGRRLRFELSVKPRGYVVVNHIHPTQEERFEMKQGRLKLLCGKDSCHISAGEVFTIPKKMPHQWWNETDEEVILDVTFTPAGKMEFFLEQFFGLCNDGRCNDKGMPPFMQIMAFSNEYEMYIAGPPVLVQKIMSGILAPVARLMGYKKHYSRYAK